MKNVIFKVVTYLEGRKIQVGNATPKLRDAIQIANDYFGKNPQSTVEIVRTYFVEEVFDSYHPYKVTIYSDGSPYCFYKHDDVLKFLSKCISQEVGFKYLGR